MKKNKFNPVVFLLILCALLAFAAEIVKYSR